ncbi:hypothetical protein NP493_31g04005 [Ridgeia piscesae]|uniref:Uncharacterized protein n=1 Tax=Ridgeia piscesae TaxID=27915 RepID=A0AAD9UK28_RIDPI|nr:hypothetical protein NP493_31g04005 [Ridgeia piscesae]
MADVRPVGVSFRSVIVIFAPVRHVPQRAVVRHRGNSHAHVVGFQGFWVYCSARVSAAVVPIHAEFVLVAFPRLHERTSHFDLAVRRGFNLCRAERVSPERVDLPVCRQVPLHPIPSHAIIAAIAQADLKKNTIIIQPPRVDAKHRYRIQLITRI